MRSALRAISTQMPRDLVFAVLADFARYPEWLPAFSSTRTLAREGDVTLLEVRAPTLRRESAVFEVIVSPEEEIRFTQIGQPGKPEVAGRWHLWTEETPDLWIGLELRADIPLFQLGSWRRLHKAGAAALEAVEKRLDAERAGKLPPPGSSRKIVEIVEGREGFELHLPGERYRLVEIPSEGAPP